MVTINEDLVKERAKCDFDMEEMVRIIDGGEDETLARRKLENKLLAIADFKDETPIAYLSHKEKGERVVERLSFFLQFLTDYLMENAELLNFIFTPSKVFRAYNAVLPDSSVFLAHYGMFLTTIFNQATDQQQRQWLKPGSRVFGAYAQTELGHGSNVKSLETISTYDPETEEFILNTPTLSSYKWWPGGLGGTANHVILMAQLYINGTNHGIHSFFVPIRDLDTHMPHPGVKVGEIGPKLAVQTIGHGFLGLDNYRIPRNNMLMKYAQVLKDGTYVKSGKEKLMYSTLMFARMMIMTDVSFELARAATIAVRYSAVRRQSHIKPNEPEVQILDFVTQQHKLFIAVATSHAYRVVGLWLFKTYSETVEDMNSGNFDRLPELHALTCCFKAVSSRDGTTLVEQCRLACGGHGYMMSSNLPNLHALSAAAITYDGEHTVLLLQTARYLIKIYREIAEGKVTTKSTISYLEKMMNKNTHKWSNTPLDIIEGFQAISLGKIRAAHSSLEKYLRFGKSYEEAWNLSSIKLTEASEAHARAVLCDVFWKETQSKILSVSGAVGLVLEQLAELYLTYFALERRGDLLLYTNISGEDIEILQARYEELLSLIRPNAVALVDAFDFRDEILDSTLGSYDGRVYERLMEDAKKSPLNAEPVNESFHKYLKPVLAKTKL